MLATPNSPHATQVTHMPNVTLNPPPTPLPDEASLPLLELVQQRLRTILGKGYCVVLAGSGGLDAAEQYHLSIVHERSGNLLETSGSTAPGFIEHVLGLGRRMKAMLEAPVLNQPETGTVRLLTWISDSA